MRVQGAYGVETLKESRDVGTRVVCMEPWCPWSVEERTGHGRNLEQTRQAAWKKFQRHVRENHSGS